MTGMHCLSLGACMMASAHVAHGDHYLIIFAYMIAAVWAAVWSR